MIISNLGCGGQGRMSHAIRDDGLRLARLGPDVRVLRFSRWHARSKASRPRATVVVIGMLRLRSARQFFGVSLGLGRACGCFGLAVTRRVKGLQPFGAVMVIGMLRLRSARQVFRGATIDRSLAASGMRKRLSRFVTIITAALAALPQSFRHARSAVLLRLHHGKFDGELVYRVQR